MTIPATVRADWKRPEPPKCNICGMPLDLVAVQDGFGLQSEWYLLWDEECPNGHDHDITPDEGINGENDWPFEELVAYPADWTALGIRTETA